MTHGCLGSPTAGGPHWGCWTSLGPLRRSGGCQPSPPGSRVLQVMPMVLGKDAQLLLGSSLTELVGQDGYNNHHFLSLSGEKSSAKFMAMEHPVFPVHLRVAPNRYSSSQFSGFFWLFLPRGFQAATATKAPHSAESDYTGPHTPVTCRPPNRPAWLYQERQPQHRLLREKKTLRKCPSTEEKKKDTCIYYI